VRRSVLILVVISSFTFLLGLGRPAITNSDEGFYAEAAREMVAEGDCLTPHFNYEDRWQKPVLYYWLTAATGVATRTLGAVPYPNVANVRLRTLISPVPTRDLETVLLLTNR